MGNVRSPAVRGNVARRVLNEAAEIQGGPVQRVLSAELVERIQSAAALDWIALDDYMLLCDAVHEQLGDAQYRECWRGLVNDLAGGFLLQPMVEAGTRIFGARWDTMLHMAPMAWNLVMRDCGALRVLPTATPAVCELELRDTPTAVHDSQAWVTGLVGALLACLDLTNTTGEVGANISEPGVVRFRAEATPA